jgi:hypothetical protein
MLSVDRPAEAMSIEEAQCLRSHGVTLRQPDPEREYLVFLSELPLK